MSDKKSLFVNGADAARMAPENVSDELERAQDVARRYRCEYVNLTDFSLQHDLFKKIPVDLMFRYNFVPLEETRDGVLTQAMPPIGREHHSTIISRIKVMSELDIAERRVPQDGRFRVKYNGRAIDFRVSVMPSIHGEDAVLRVLDKESMSEKFRTLVLDVVGFDEEDLRKFRRYIKEPYGMVLVTGPTGSGKTTTLYAAVNEIKTDEDKIITIEDPVEYQIRGITQIPVNEKKGLTFARGLRSILRHDPDKIMVGEIR